MLLIIHNRPHVIVFSNLSTQKSWISQYFSYLVNYEIFVEEGLRKFAPTSHFDLPTKNFKYFAQLLFTGCILSSRLAGPR